MSESEQEGNGQVERQTIRYRHRHHPNKPSKKTSTSDFEQGYAANAAPRYLTQSRRSLGTSSRIPGPGPSSFHDPVGSSRMPSPEKSARDESTPSRATSPTPQRKAAGGSKGSKGKQSVFGSTIKDKTPARSNLRSANTTFRRPTVATGGKVSNLAKQFERINKDSEKASRRYAVIRGRKARPVTFARAKVEILDSVKDAIRDESESSSSSSEADDEGGGEDDDNKGSGNTGAENSPEDSLTLPSTSTSSIEPITPVINESPEEMLSSETPNEHHASTPPSTQAPTLEVTPTSLPPSPLMTPQVDVEQNPTERNSILKALSTLWPQQFPQPRQLKESDEADPTSDGEHIFRDSSMVVRVDEPTSIIALALK